MSDDPTVIEIQRQLAAIGMPADEATATSVREVLSDVAKATQPLGSVAVGEAVPAMLGNHLTCAKLLRPQRQ